MFWSASITTSSCVSSSGDPVGRYAGEIVSASEISARAHQRTCIPRRGTNDCYYQAVAIQHRRNGAFVGDLDAGKSADETLTDFAGTPTTVLAFHVENKIFHLKKEVAERSGRGGDFYSSAPQGRIPDND